MIFFLLELYTHSFLHEHCLFLLFKVEVFNILFVKEVGKKHLVHCLDCARKCSPVLEDFIMLEEYTMEDLKDVYDNFILHPVSRIIFTIILIPIFMYINNMLFSWFNNCKFKSFI